MKNAAANLAAATALTLTLALSGAVQAAETTHAAEAAHGEKDAHAEKDAHGAEGAHGAGGHGKEEVILPVEGDPNEADFGEIGTGATKRGTAGGGTRTTNHNAIGSGSYGLRPAYAQKAANAAEAAPVSGVAFATAPGLALPAAGQQGQQAQQATTGTLAAGAQILPAAFAALPAGARGTSVRDHSFPSSPNAPGPGGYYRPNSVPNTVVGPLLPSYFASPEGRSLPIEVPHHDTDLPTKKGH